MRQGPREIISGKFKNLIRQIKCERGESQRNNKPGKPGERRPSLFNPVAGVLCLEDRELKNLPLGAEYLK